MISRLLIALEYVRNTPVPSRGSCFSPESALAKFAPLSQQDGRLYLSRKKLPWSFCFSVKLWSTEKPHEVCRVSRTPICDVMLAPKPFRLKVGAGINGESVLESGLKQFVGIIFPGNCCPGAAPGVQPAGIRAGLEAQAAGTKIGIT